MQLSQLNPGDNFEFVGLSHYRKLHVRKTSENSVIIGGERKNEDGTWTHLPSGYAVATGCDVRKLAGKTIIKEKKPKIEPLEAQS